MRWGWRIRAVPGRAVDRMQKERAVCALVRETMRVLCVRGARVCVFGWVLLASFLPSAVWRGEEMEMDWAKREGRQKEKTKQHTVTNNKNTQQREEKTNNREGGTREEQGRGIRISSHKKSLESKCRPLWKVRWKRAEECKFMSSRTMLVCV